MSDRKKLLGTLDRCLPVGKVNEGCYGCEYFDGCTFLDVVSLPARFIEDVRAYLKSQEPVEPHWISVKDRLPEDNTDYLCYFGDHPLWPSIGIAPWRGERGFYSIEMERPIPYITHWMKLPLPPKHQEEQKNDKA